MATTFARISLQIGLQNCGRIIHGPAAVSSQSVRTLFGIFPKTPKYGPDPLEHATGLEKKELLAYEAGNMDPFEVMPRKRGPGTREEPNLVPSTENKRMIGCVCHEEALYISYTWIHKGEPKRCACGYWFKLVPGSGIVHPSWYQ